MHLMQKKSKTSRGDDDLLAELKQKKEEAHGE